MRVLVTGASGFLGSYIAEQLSKRGDQVRCLVRKSSSRKFLDTLQNIEYANGSVEDRDSVFRACEGVDAIVHSAGLVKARAPSEFHLVNVEGTRNMLDGAVAAGKKDGANKLKRFVFVSSLAAVGPSRDGTPVRSDAVPSPVTHYGRSKLESEKLVLSMKEALPVTVIRPPMIYGPRDTESLQLFQWVARGILPMNGDGSNTLSLIYADDAASACVRAIDSDAANGKSYFVEDGSVYEWKLALRDIENALGKKAFVRFGIPFSVVRAMALASEVYGKVSDKAMMLTRDKVNELEQKHWVCSAADTKNDLGWTPEVPWSEGTKRAVDWYRKEGWL
ncbi:MAG: NAD(P)-dependent oxidoreductase [Polyangiaceae bacterium]|nr:NAD(P)-dependent oxidoreductase [Polyangiaceae bacterium]